MTLDYSMYASGRTYRTIAALGMLLGLSGWSLHALAQEQGTVLPRLVLQVTVDGLRGDLLKRYSAGFRDDGFHYLLRNGTYYANAHYRHANTETIVGHTVLATGAQPSVHGMTGNVWYDRASGELSYNIEDPDALLLLTRNKAETADQVDPAQKLARTDGRSPKAILVPTLADTLAAHFAGRSKIYAVSGKDRGAVPLAGHVGKAFWFSTDSGHFISSKYYYDAYPEWVQRWNGRNQASHMAGSYWELAEDKQTYLFAEHDDRPYELDLKGYGRTFPHRFGDLDNPSLYTQITASPYGDELLLDFVKSLLESEKIGQDSVPDYLSISFSGVDAVNHFFGPSSLENEAIVRRLDSTLAALWGFIDDTVGLHNTVIVFSADHGMADMPEAMAARGYPAGRIDPSQLISLLDQAGREMGIQGVVKLLYRPYLYLDREKIERAGHEYSSVVGQLARVLEQHEGINRAIAVQQDAPDSFLLEAVRNNHHQERSGDLYLVQEPYWFMFDGGPIPAMHGSPWRYDTHVPIIFSVPGNIAGTVYRQVQPADIAPTISALLGSGPPAASTGKILLEVLRRP